MPRKLGIENRNHFHLVIKMPQPNLVIGMKRLLSRYASASPGGVVAVPVVGTCLRARSSRLASAAWARAGNGRVERRREHD